MIEVYELMHVVEKVNRDVFSSLFLCTIRFTPTGTSCYIPWEACLPACSYNMYTGLPAGVMYDPVYQNDYLHS